MPNVQENIKAKKEREAKAAESKKKRWIFKSLSNMTLVVRPRKTKYVYGKAGEVLDTFKTTPIRAIFEHGTFELNEGVKRNYGIPIEDVATLMIENPMHGKSYKLVWGPDFEPDEGLLDYAERADGVASRRQPRLSQGVRAQRNRVRP